MQVDIRLLGGFEVVVDGAPVPAAAWRRRHAAALVKVLALDPGHRLTRDQVMDLLWPDLPVAEAAPRLHKAAHFARGALAVPDAVVLSGDAVSLLPGARVSVDVERFDAAAAAAARSDAGARAGAAAEALEQYAGPLLPDDIYEPWTEGARDRCRLRYLELRRQAGRWEELVGADPGDEDAHLQLVRRLLSQGDRRAALRQLEQMEQALWAELGVAPSDAALALRDAISAGARDEKGLPARAFGRSTPLPALATPTIGRDRDVAEALAVLETARIVTLLGPGGVGKTTLAVEVAARRSDATSVEACFVDLTSVDRPDAVPALIVGDLGVHRAAGTDAELVLQEALRGRALLLVLDNFEHVIEAAPLVARIAGWSSRVEVLVTSRARLQVTGEHVFDVRPLDVGRSDGVPARGSPPGAAVALFDQVARAVEPSFDLAAHLGDVTAICRAVEGLPLAIKLAAGHVRTLPPSLLRVRLTERLGSPSGATRDSPPRQRTVPATIDWSLQLLGAPEQRLFARLGAFAGPVGFEAVEAVCTGPGDDPGDVVDTLGRLVDQSLVHRVPGPGGVPRFGMLELLRERARELLADADEVPVRDRHARYVAGMLDSLEEHRWTDAGDRWIDLISDALAEVRTAHAWANSHAEPVLAARITADLGVYWHREGHDAEGRRWVADALADEAEYDEHLAARLRVAAGFVTWPRDASVAREHWTTAAERFRRLGDDRYLAYSLAHVCGTYLGEPDSYEHAMAMCEESVRLARQVGNLQLIAETLEAKGELARWHGDDDLAQAAYTEGRDLAAATDDQVLVGVFMADLSFLADHRGDHEEARRLGRDALRLCWSRGRRMMAAWSVSELAGPELGLGRPERAAVLVGAGSQALRTLGASPHPADVTEHERIAAGLRTHLSPDTLDRLLAEGAALPLDRAVGLALADDLEEPAPRGRSQALAPG